MPRLHEARFGYPPATPLVFREILPEEPRAPRSGLRDRSNFENDERWRTYLERELEAARGRDDQAIIEAAETLLAEGL